MLKRTKEEINIAIVALILTLVLFFYAHEAKGEELISSTISIELRNGKAYALDLGSVKLRKQPKESTREPSHHVYYTIPIRKKSLYIDYNWRKVTVGDRHGTYSGLGYSYSVDNTAMGVHVTPSRYLANITWRY
jgi:hypothetical protein